MAGNDKAPPDKKKASRADTKQKTSAQNLPGDDNEANDPDIVGDIESVSLDDVLSERDLFLDEALVRDPMPDSRDEIAARDPFSADYMEFLREKALRNRVDPREVDTELRANLLEKPYLTERPEEAGLRGAAAVWRSLRDQIHEESLNLIDTSGRHELLILQRELIARKTIVETVDKGLGMLLDRLRQRLEELPPDNGSVSTKDDTD